MLPSFFVAVLSSPPDDRRGVWTPNITPFESPYVLKLAPQNNAGLPGPWVPVEVQLSGLRSKVLGQFLTPLWWTPPPSRSPAHVLSGWPATWLQTPGEEEVWRGEEMAAGEESLEHKTPSRLSVMRWWLITAAMWIWQNAPRENGLMSH